MKAIQKVFSGGMNLLLDDANISELEYGYANNVSCRFGTLKPFGQSTKLTSVTGYKQGLFFLGNYMILVNSGLAYWAELDETTTPVFTKIDNFELGEFNNIWGVSLPAASSNLLRKAVDPANAYTDVTLSPDVTVGGTPQCLLVQDGINRPWVIYWENEKFVARKALDVDEWTKENPEFVPLGCMMTYMNGITFIVAPNRKYIYRSVSGRPLDFMVAIQADGEESTMYEPGGVDTVLPMALTVGYDDITCLRPLNNGDLFVATTDDCFAITLNYDIQMFGEPLYTLKKLFSTGVVNDESFIDILGDYGFITYNGIRSFNAVLQDTSEGRNDVFTLKVDKLFRGVTQDVCCAGYWDDYALFSFTSYYGGPGILIYDALTKVHNCVYRSSSIEGIIKQFGISKIINKRIFAITDDDVYELFNNTTPEVTQVSTRSFAYDDPRLEHKIQCLKTIFVQNSTEGDIVTSCVVDGKNCGSKEGTLEASVLGVAYPACYPVAFTGSTIAQKTFYFPNPLTGWKISFFLSWTNGAELTRLSIESEDRAPEQSIKEQTRICQ